MHQLGHITSELKVRRLESPELTQRILVATQALQYIFSLHPPLQAAITPSSPPSSPNITPSLPRSKQSNNNNTVKSSHAECQEIISTLTSENQRLQFSLISLQVMSIVIILNLIL